MSDEDLTLRDKLAAAALPAIIDRYTNHNHKKWVEDGKLTDAFDAQSEMIIRIAYKFADKMRKIRLETFA